MSVRNVSTGVLCVLLSGCLDVPQPMEREKVIEAIQQCRAADLDPSLYRNFNNRIVEVQCRIREECAHDRRD